MNIFTFFLQKFSKIFSKTHQITSFLKIFLGEHALKPPSKCMISPPVAWRFACQYMTLFQKYFNPPPSPQNKILDTPLLTLALFNRLA